MPALPTIRPAHHACVVAVALLTETRGVPPSAASTLRFPCCFAINVCRGRTAVDSSPPLPTFDIHRNP